MTLYWHIVGGAVLALGIAIIVRNAYWLFQDGRVSPWVEGTNPRVPVLGPLLCFWGFLACPVPFSNHIFWVFAVDPGTVLGLLRFASCPHHFRSKTWVEKGTIIATVILVIAAGIYLWSLEFSDTEGPQPLDFPISLRVGDIESPEFRTGGDLRYCIALVVDRGSRNDELRCLGICDACQPEHCRARSSVVDIRWSLLEGGKEVASDTKSAARAGDCGPGGLYKTLGWFDGRSGEAYRLHLKVMLDGSALDDANPKIVVAAPMQKDKDVLIMASLAALVCLFLTGFSTMILAIAYLPTLMRRDKDLG